MCKVQAPHYDTLAGGTTTDADGEDGDASDKSAQTSSASSIEWKQSLHLALLSSATYVCTYWWRSPIFCFPVGYTNETILEFADGTNMTFATGIALAYSVGNIVGKFLAMFLLTTQLFYRKRLLVTSLLFVTTAFLNGFGVAAFDSAVPLIAPSPVAQVFISAGLAQLPCSVLYGVIFSYMEGMCVFV